VAETGFGKTEATIMYSPQAFDEKILGWMVLLPS